MSPPPDLSGHWQGFYTRHDHPRPMTAEFDQDGDRLTGTMNDDCTLFDASVSDLVMEEALPPGTDEQIVERLRSMVPELPEGPVHAEVMLPHNSVVDGEVQGHTVRFLKTYQGTYFTGYRVGDLRIGMTSESHEVQYRGSVSLDGTEIEGRWYLEQVSIPGLSRRAEGGFWLRKRGIEPCF